MPLASVQPQREPSEGTRFVRLSLAKQLFVLSGRKVRFPPFSDGQATEGCPEAAVVLGAMQGIWPGWTQWALSPFGQGWIAGIVRFGGAEWPATVRNELNPARRRRPGECRDSIINAP